MIEGENIYLRALEPADVDFLYQWENDRENWRISHTVSPYSREILKDYIKSVNDIYTDKQLRLIICTKEDDKPIGALDLFEFDFKNSRAGVGILIANKKERQKGYAAECIKVTKNYASKTLNLKQLWCNILLDNEASIALFKKLGFTPVGVKAKWTRINGVFQDELLMQCIF